MRENNGEIELAKKEKDSSALPNLIQYDSLKGDLQVHSKDTDGMMSIQDIASAAREKFGLEYIAITTTQKV